MLEQLPEEVHAKPENWRATATFSYGPNSGQLASAVAASTRASVGQMSQERIDRRTDMMRKQVKKRNSVTKYKIEGPIHWEGDEDQTDQDDSDDSENDIAASGKSGGSWFIAQAPEWVSKLPQFGDALEDTFPSATDGTPSPYDDEAYDEACV